MTKPHAHQKTGSKRDKRLLHPGWQTLMLAALAGIVKCEAADIPQVFMRPKPHALKIGIREDLLARFPDADAKQVGEWFGRWCRTTQYQMRIANGQNRHDLDGNDCGTISDAQRAQAKVMLAKLIAKRRAKAL